MREPKLLDYADGEQICEAYVAFPAASGPRPCVLLVHDWSGRLDRIDRQADALAAAGYVAFAIDVYGKGVRGSPQSDNSELMNPFVADRPALRRRLVAALDAACELPEVDETRIAAVGYCFGGLCALDLARSGDPRLRGAVSIHGVLAPPPGDQGPIGASVLVLHGWEDQMSPPEVVQSLARELTDAGADWQIQLYGQTMHAFTVPGLNAPEQGLAYNAAADRRSTLALANFLEEILGDSAAR